MASPIKSLISQTAVYGLSSIVGRFLNYLLVPIYTHLFLRAEYGIVSEMYAYVSILLVILTYGLETGFFRFSQNEKYSKASVYSTALTSLLVSSLFFSLLLVLFGHQISKAIDYEQNTDYIILLGLTVALDAISAIPFAKLRNENKAARFAYIKIVNIGLNIFFNVFFLIIAPLAFGSNNIFDRIFYQGVNVGYIFLANFLSSLFTLFFLAPEMLSGIKPFTFKWGLLKELLLYSYPLLFVGIAGMMSENLDRILIKYLTIVPAAVSDSKQYLMAQVGVYGANAKIAVLMTLFIQAYRYAAEPFFFSYAKQTDSRVMYARVMNYFIVFSLFIFLVITLFIDFTKFIIDASYHEGLVIVPILLIGKILFGIAFNLSIWYKLTNRTHFGATLSFLQAFFSIGLNILLIPLMGYLGAAWAALGSYFVLMIISLILGNKYYPILYDYKRIFLYTGIALILYVVNLFSREITEYYLILNFIWVVLFVYLFIRIQKINLRLVLSGFKRNS